MDALLFSVGDDGDDDDDERRMRVQDLAVASTPARQPSQERRHEYPIFASPKLYLSTTKSHTLLKPKRRSGALREAPLSSPSTHHTGH